MQIPVLIEPLSANTFRARSGEPLPLSVEAATAAEAMCKLKELLESKLHNGTQLTTLDIGPQAHPLASLIGSWSPDDPMIADWQEAVEEYRRKIDEEAVIASDPWSRVAGMYADNPRFEEWQANIVENRRKADEEDGISR